MCKSNDDSSETRVSLELVGAPNERRMQLSGLWGERSRCET